MFHQGLDKPSIFQEQIIQAYILLQEWLDGSVLANVFGYGRFEQVSWIDMLVSCIFIGVMVVVRRKQNAREMRLWLQAKRKQARQEASSQPEISFRLPPGFELDAFLTDVATFYTHLYQKKDVSSVFISAALKAKLNTCIAQHQSLDVKASHFRLLSADHNHHRAQIYVQCVSCTHHKMDETWLLERDLLTPESPWILADIQFISQRLKKSDTEPAILPVK